MQLIPITIGEINDDSAINVPNTVNEIRLAFSLEVVGTGDFSKFVKDGELDVKKLISAIFQGDVYISTRSKQ